MVRNYILDHKSIKGFKPSGQGAFGDVARAVYRDRCVAVKTYKKEVPSGVIEREIAIMQTMRHERHVIQYLGHFNVDGIAHVVMDFAYNLSLFQLLKTVLKQMSRSLRTRIAKDICRGLLAFHQRGMVHEDIKSDNVVLDFGLRARLCDFGSSRRVDEPPVHKSGTPAFRAPEREKYIQGKTNDYDPIKSEIYSLGVVLSRLLACTDKSIAVRCKSPDPNERPTCAQVLEQLGKDDRVPYDHFSGFFPLQPTEAEKFNLAYNWTGFKFGKEPESLSHVRELMFRGDYKQVKEKLADIDDQPPALQLMGAIADFYGSRERDSRAQSRFVLEAIKHKFEGGSMERLTADYFSAAYALEVDEREGAKMLYRLSINGNALAQVELSKFHGCKRRVWGDLLPSRIAETASFMCSAASSGLANAQAMLTILYLLQHGSTSVPGSVKVSLDTGVEGGSPIGWIIKDVAENKVYEMFEANPDLYKNVALIQLCGDICRILKRTERSKMWYSVAAEAGCADAAHCLAVMALKEGDYSSAERWCKKAVQLKPGPKRSGKPMVEDMFLRDPKFFLITSEYLMVVALVLQGRMAEAIEKVKASTDYSDDGLMSLFRIERACSGDNSNVWYELLCEKSGHADSAETLSYIAESYVSNWKSYSLNFVDFVTPPADPTKSLHFSSEGAERGHHHSICRLAELLCNQRGESDRGIALLQQVSQEGYAPASLGLAGHLESIGNPQKSMEYYELASGQGDAKFKLELAKKILDSQPKRAKQLLKQCLEEGYLEACKHAILPRVQ